jgi:5'-nucleotidase
VAVSPEGETVLIVQVQDWNRYLGDLRVTFDEAGLVSAWSGAPVLMSADLPPNTEVAAYLTEKQAQAQVLFGAVIGSTAETLSNADARTGECALGNLVADAFLWEMQDEGYEIAITNGGGIRASLNAGDITIENVMTVLPFDNYLSTLKLTGENVKKVLENGLTRINIPADGETGTGRFAQVSGLRFTYDRTREKYDRILSIEVKNADGSFSPIDPTRVYKVVTNDFMRGGGDEYTVLEEEAIEPYDFGRKLSDILIDYIKAHASITPVVEGRIVEVSGQ